MFTSYCWILDIDDAKCRHSSFLVSIVLSNSLLFDEYIQILEDRLAAYARLLGYILG